MNDTTPEAARLYHELLMAKTEDERFCMGLSMCESVRGIVLDSLPPGLSESERRVALLHRYYGDDFPPEELARIEAAVRDLN